MHFPPNAFTKSLRFWVKRINDIPDNLILTASYGGFDDHMIKEYNLKSAMVVASHNKEEEIDTNDDLARIKGISFFLIKK